MCKKIKIKKTDAPLEWRTRMAHALLFSVVNSISVQNTQIPWSIDSS